MDEYSIYDYELAEADLCANDLYPDFFEENLCTEKNDEYICELELITL